MKRESNIAGISGLPSTGIVHDSVEKQAAFDQLPAAIRYIINEAPVPIDAVNILYQYRRLGEARIITELHKFIAQQFPGYSPIEKRKR